MGTSKTYQTGFGISPKAFNTIDMADFIGKFIFVVLHPEMLLKAKVNKVMATSPAVRENDTFNVYTASNNALKRCL